MKFFVILSMLFISGCATMSSVRMLDDRTAYISVNATAFGNRGDVVSSVLFESAKAASKRGFKYFTITNSDNYEIVKTYYAPSRTEVTTTYNKHTQKYESSAVTTPSSQSEMRYPAQEVTIRMYNEGEINSEQDGVWHVDKILSANN